MNRVGLKQSFHGEPNLNQEGLAAGQDELEEVTLDVRSGRVKFLVPADVPDDKLIQNEFLERFFHCVLELENGAELSIWINEGSHGVDLRMRAAQEKAPQGIEPAAVPG